MATYWWKAICDEHREACDVINVANSGVFVPESEERMAWAFMTIHFGCKLRLAHDDATLEEIEARGYTLLWRTARAPGVVSAYLNRAWPGAGDG